MNYNDDYSIDGDASIGRDNLSESDTIISNNDYIAELDLFQARKDERYSITCALYEHLKNLINNHNLTNNNVLGAEKMNYLSFREWIDVYITE
jgi:hypothetical protein